MKSGIILILIVLMAGIAGFFILGDKTVNPAQGKVINDKTSVQKITLSMKNLNYFPQTITAKSGMPVELTLDHGVSGCFRSFTIKALGVSKYSKSPDDKIIFTPKKKGTYRFSCSMGMGYGTIVIE